MEKNINVFGDNLFIPFRNNYQNAAFRIFDEDARMIFYASTRLGTLKRVDANFNMNSESAAGCIMDCKKDCEFENEPGCKNNCQAIDDIGYLVEGISHLAGKKYELKIIPAVEIITGIIQGSNSTEKQSEILYDTLR